MASDFKESDWKTLRGLMDVALNRLCARILDEVTAAAGDEGFSPHERYLKVFQIMRDGDADMAHAFNDPRRSNARWKLAAIRSLDLLTDEEWSRFSEETRASVESFLAMDDELARAR